MGGRELTVRAERYWRRSALAGFAALSTTLASTCLLAQQPDVEMAARLMGETAGAISVKPAVGAPAAVEVTRDGRVIGYVATTWQTVGSIGYSGRPIDVLVAVDTEARIAGAKLVSQSEPILTIGITEEDIAAYVEGFRGYNLRTQFSASDAGRTSDAISGATHSSAVIRDAIIRTARLIALSRGLLGPTDAAAVDRVTFEPRTWASLIGDGAVARRHLTVGDVRASLGKEAYGAAGVADDALLADLHLALLTPPTIGQNLIGQRDYQRLTASIGAADNAILIASSGLYSFKGTDWRRTGIFERVELHQGGRTIRLTDAGYLNVTRIAAEGAPEFREVGVFVVPEQSGFEPAKRWHISLMVDSVPGVPIAGTMFDLAYALPATYLDKPAMPEISTLGDQRPVWVEAWRESTVEIALVAVLLVALSAILVFQDAVARRYTFYRAVRLGFLAVTVVGLGWLLGAQLSVVHVVAFAHSIISGFQWETFLLDPPIFILWSFVAMALLFWGRGVFCGWLCPFGALQELINEAARVLGIRQIEVPFGLQERLWPLKYIIFLGLFAVSLGSIKQAFVLAEVEPFKTAVTLGFIRAWPFVAYALLLLTAGLFIERFYCRYLCPLGAALAIPARLRMFEWLKRRHQCGRECRICATRCTVGAIHPHGHINPNECIYCLNCQTLYYDANTCPVLKARQRRRAAPVPASSPARLAGGEAGSGAGGNR